MSKEILSRAEARLATIESVLLREIPGTEGNLLYHRKGAQVKYYKKAGDHAVPLSSRQEAQIRLLAQKRYEQTLRKFALWEKAAILRAIRVLAKALPFETAASAVPGDIMRFVVPWGGKDEDYAARWQKVRYRTNKKEKKDSIVTARGEKVRSKSEALIADRLLKAGIPYHYEAELDLKDDGVYYPDFLVLNKRTRQVFIWEHFGRLGDSDYAYKSLRKIRIYKKHGYELGKNFLMTFESPEHVFDTTEADRLIDEYLL